LYFFRSYDIFRYLPIFSPILPIFSFSDPRRYFAAADVGNTVGMAETGQRYDEPLHEKKEGRSTQDTSAEPDLGGNHPLQMERLPLDGQDVT
jgi:hypothetical protein